MLPVRKALRLLITFRFYLRQTADTFICIRRQPSSIVDRHDFSCLFLLFVLETVHVYFQQRFSSTRVCAAAFRWRHHWASNYAAFRDIGKNWLFPPRSLLYLWKFWFVIENLFCFVFFKKFWLRKIQNIKTLCRTFSFMQYRCEIIFRILCIYKSKKNSLQKTHLNLNTSVYFCFHLEAYWRHGGK